MPDFHSPEDEVTLYVLGELTVVERREFEARMAKSAELRRMVCELEEGVVVLSAGLPRRRPPPEVWAGIEKAVGRQRKPDVAVWWGVWWRNGWAAAALCLAGWLLYAILLNSHNAPKAVTTQPALPHETVVANSSPPTEHKVPLPPTLTNTERQLLQVRAEEISDLRLKIAAMAQQSNELSQLLAQERARLGETNRIKFLQFTSSSSPAGDTVGPKLSSAMQRAVLISIGRELGWLPMTARPRPGNSHAATTIDGIDFVDLRSPNNNPDTPPSNPSTVPPVNPPPGQPQVESQIADVSEPSIPAFVSGDKMVVGLDSSVVPPNSLVTLALADSSGGTLIWNVAVGNNPTMVTVPIPGGIVSEGGLRLTANSVTSSGISNVTQFFTTTSP